MSTTDQPISSWRKIQWFRLISPTHWLKVLQDEVLQDEVLLKQYLLDVICINGREAPGWGVSSSTTYHHQSCGYIQFLPYLQVEFSIILKAETPEDEVTWTRVHKKLVLPPPLADHITITVPHRYCHLLNLFRLKKVHRGSLEPAQFN